VRVRPHAGNGPGRELPTRALPGLLRSAASAPSVNVGLIQIMPGTWTEYGRDGNADGIADPHNVYDSAQGAVAELCHHPIDLGDRNQLSAALFRYDHSSRYVRQVLHWIGTYDQLGQSVALGVGGSVRGQVIVNAARRWPGLPYSWGGGGTNGPSYGTGGNPLEP
jgi:hypothetical protein